MITNRPRPPVDIALPDEFAEYSLNAGPYWYFMNHVSQLAVAGIDVYPLTTAGQFVDILNLNGSGVMEFGCIGIENRSNQSRSWGGRLVIDDSVIANNVQLAGLTRNTDTGLMIFGAMFWEENGGGPVSFATDSMVFKRNFLLQLYMSSTSQFNICAALKVRLTGSALT